MKPEAVRVERGELFRQVWERPLQRVAASYGLSDKGLAKICDRLDVPYPPRGYWAKQAHGKKTKPGALQVNPDAPAFVMITGTVRAKPGPLSPSDKAIVAKIVEAAETEGSILRATGDATLDARRIRLQAGLRGAAEAAGFTTGDAEPRGTFIALGGARVEFYVTERLVTMQRGAAEVRALVLSIHSRALAGRREWRDALDRPLESRLPEIARDIATRVLERVPPPVNVMPPVPTAAPAAVPIEPSRHAAEAQAQEDNRRWDRFTRRAEAWRAAEVARQYLAAIEARDPDRLETVGGQPIGEWLAWAHAQVDQRAKLDAKEALAYALKSSLFD